jgi:hypothetical protein
MITIDDRLAEARRILASTPKPDYQYFWTVNGSMFKVPYGIKLKQLNDINKSINNDERFK